MSLLDFDDGKPGIPVTRVYFYSDFVNWRGRLIRFNPLALPAIQAEIDSHFTAASGHPAKQLLTMSWIPGEDWTGTVYQDIYLSNLPRFGRWTPSAHAYAHDTAAKLLGLLFMDNAITRPDRWGSGHYLKDGIPIRGRTYFRI
jgi:hypothetical protein